MKRRPGAWSIVSLAVAAVVVAGCGGQTSAPPSAGSTAAAPSSDVASPAPSTSPAPSSSGSSSGSSRAIATVPSPCDTIDSAAMSKLIGVDMGQATKKDDNESKTCTYAGTAKGRTLALVAIGQLNGSLKSLASSGGSKAKIADLSIDGFADAYSISRTEGNAQIGGVAAEKDGLAYLVGITGSKTSADYVDASKKIVTELASS